MASELALYDSVLSSNLPAREKSHLRRWFENTTGLNLSPAKMGGQVKGGLTTFRQYSEAGLAGGLLGLIHAEAKGGLDAHGVPLDGMAAAILGIGSVWAGDHELSPDARNIGSHCFAVFSFRKTEELLVQKKLSKGQAVPSHLIPGTKIHGESEVGAEDPIVAVSRNL